MCVREVIKGVKRAWGEKALGNHLEGVMTWRFKREAREGRVKERRKIRGDEEGGLGDPAQMKVVVKVKIQIRRENEREQ